MPKRIWHPVPGTKVVLSIDADTGRQAKAFHTNLDLKWKKHGHQTLRLDDPRLPRIIDAIDSSARGVRLGGAWLEEPAPQPSHPDAWFELLTGPTEFRTAARAPKDLHFADRKDQQLASAVFLDVVRAAGLSGLASLPLPDARPTDPMSWY